MRRYPDVTSPSHTFYYDQYDELYASSQNHHSTNEHTFFHLYIPYFLINAVLNHALHVLPNNV